MAPKRFPQFFQRISKDNTGTLLKYIQFQNLIQPTIFQNEKKNKKKKKKNVFVK